MDPILPMSRGGHTGAPDPLRQTATRLETHFLSEMLKAAGLGQARESFGGGAGEEQFASFLREAQAVEIVRAGGLGLAGSIHDALLRAQARQEIEDDIGS